MPSEDPLTGIMAMLRRQNAIDPGTAAQRQAAIGTQRAQAGASPRRTGQPQGQPPGGAMPQVSPDMEQFPPGTHPADAAAPLEDRRTPEEGMEGEMTAPESMMPTVIDALNESIIAMKVEIHRTPDEEERKNLESQANKIRRQIQALGGDPIRADESIEEGVRKISGRGYMHGMGRGMGAGTATGQAQDPKQELLPMLNLSPVERSLQLGLGTQEEDPILGRGLGAGAATGEHTPEQPTPEQLVGMAQTEGVARKAEMEPVQPPPKPEEAPAAARAAGDWWDMGAPEAQPQDQLSQVMQQLGGAPSPPGVPGISPAPEAQVDAQYVHNILQEYGVTPRSDEEIQAHAAAIVERQSLQKEQIVQRELDRFEREFPQEFARARDRMQEEAQAISAERQEEFSNRGMYYASVMESTLSSIDSERLDKIAEISSQAASHVTELRADLRDIAEWAVVEEEALRHELEVEERHLARDLASMRIEAAMHGDRMALDAWHGEQQMRLQRAQIQTQQWQTQAQLYTEQARMAMEASMHQDQMQLAWAGHDLDAQRLAADMALQQQRIAMDRQQLNHMLAGEEPDTFAYSTSAYQNVQAALEQGNVGFARQVLGEAQEQGLTQPTLGVLADDISEYERAQDQPGLWERATGWLTRDRPTDWQWQ